MKKAQRRLAIPLIVSLVPLLFSCVIPGLGTGSVDMKAVFVTPEAFSGPDYRVFDTETFGFRRTVFECDPLMKHDDPFEITDDFRPDKLYVSNVTSGYYSIRAFNAPDSRTMDIKLSGFISATDEYQIDVNAVEFLGLEAEAESAAARAIVLAVDRAAAARAGGLGELGFGSADCVYPDRVALRMQAAGYPLESFPARDIPQATALAASAGLSGVRLLGQNDARGKALMASVKADLAAAGVAVLEEQYASSAEELKQKRFSGTDFDIIHYRWAIRHDDVGRLCSALNVDDLSYAPEACGGTALFYYQSCNAGEYYSRLAQDNAAIIKHGLFIPFGWRE